MNATGIVILLILVVLAVVAVALILAAQRRKRSEALQGRFGPEYDHAVGEHGDRKAAESHLSDVADRRDELEIRELSAADRESFSDSWVAVQTAFVDHPSRAVRDADTLVAEVMRKRGYPVDDFATKVDMVAADHPRVAEHYRAAHAIAGQSHDLTTEDHRQAFVHYRALFAELLDTGDQGYDADSDLDRGREDRPDLDRGREGRPDLDRGREDRSDVDLTGRDRSGATPPRQD